MCLMSPNLGRGVSVSEDLVVGIVESVAVRLVIVGDVEQTLWQSCWLTVSDAGSARPDEMS